MNYKIGCFNCGEEAYYNVEKTTTIINCVHCNHEASAFSLIVDQVAGLQDKIKEVYRSNTRLSEVNCDLEDENKILKEALEFYANYKNWQGNPDHEYYSDVIALEDSEECKETFNEGLSVGGKHAREALKKIEELN